MLKQAQKLAVELHRDDEGMETVQIIMTLAIAAMVCLGVSKVSGVAGGDNGGSILDGIGNKLGGFLGSGVGGLLDGLGF